MEDIKKWLKDYGLNDTEIGVYICILTHPEIRVVDIQKQTGLVRTTIYYTLSQLKNEGLLSENLQNNVKTYRAADIQTLQQKIETGINEQKSQLRDLGDLKSVFDNLKTSKLESSSHVARYEGIEPVKQAIEQAFRCDSKKWHIIASRDNFLYHCSKQYQQYYLKERKKRGITAKTLWEPTPEFKVQNIEDVFYRNPRLLPPEFLGAFTSLVIIYDDVTLIIDPYDQKTAYAIHDATSTQLMRLLHDFVWNNSSKV